jgi:hypothetical protein
LERGEHDHRHDGGPAGEAAERGADGTGHREPDDHPHGGFGYS